ncbi:MAG: hypothetical protein L6Q84_19650 [Polyangiaceae bacterium]|nr:hypothetical protein [Polyangiaceae bacterium]
MRSLWALCLGAALALGCGGAAPPPPAKAPPASAPPLHDGPLTDYVPSAGLRWLVVGRPKEVASDAELAKAIELLLPKPRLAAFSKSSGIALGSLDAGLIAGFDHATLYVADMRAPSTLAEERFAARLIAGTRIAKPHPRIHRLSGVVGQTPETLVRIEDRLVAVSVGSALPARIVELYARQKLTKSPSALKGSALSSLPLRELESAPMRFYAPGPFSGEWTRGAGGLLATATAVAVAVRPVAGGKLSAVIVIAGSFDSAEGDASSRFGKAWEDLTQSGLGKLLGLDRAPPPSIVATPDSIRLAVEVDALPLAQGLRAAVMAEVWEILDLSPPSDKSTDLP